MITLVLGGARSGKSEIAERLAAGRAGNDGLVTFVATAVLDGTDPDFAARIQAHRRRRPAGWTTVEAGADLVAAVRTASGPLVIDSLGTWVAAAPELAVDVEGLLQVLRRRSDDVVLVSDEVGLGVHPSTESGRRFRDALGDVNRGVAAVADEVLLVVAGRVLPLAAVD